MLKYFLPTRQSNEHRCHVEKQVDIHAWCMMLVEDNNLYGYICVCSSSTSVFGRQGLHYKNSGNLLIYGMNYFVRLNVYGLYGI